MLENSLHIFTYRLVLTGLDLVVAEIQFLLHTLGPSGSLVTTVNGQLPSGPRRKPGPLKLHSHSHIHNRVCKH